MVSDKKILNSIYSAKNHEELMNAYKDWAGNYDSDVNSFGYVAPKAAGMKLHDLLGEPAAKILDVGCGTGLVGEVLSEFGYKDVSALDYSKDMLEVSRNKGVYCDHIQADLTKPLKLADNSFDAIVCVGTFTYGHVGTEAFDEIVRITRPDGIVTFTIRDGAYQDYGYRDKMVELEYNSVWELQEMRDEDYFTHEEVQCKLCTYKIL